MELKERHQRPERDIVICECFARDGLQHEALFVETDQKIDVLNTIAEAGFERIEVSSYSHPKHVPAFADCSAVVHGIQPHQDTWFKVTCPNQRAVERALADKPAGGKANELSLLASVSESHSQRNLRSTRAEQWDKIEQMVALADGQFRLVGVLSVALGCPFEGEISPATVLEDALHFAELGVQHITVGDTIGSATPKSVDHLFKLLQRESPEQVFIAHFHNTRGTALVNCMAAIEAGCTHVDTALGGVGGHPAQISYGGGMTGNTCTEDFVFMAEAQGLRTGIDLDRLMHLSQWCEAVLERPLNSLIARTGLKPAQLLEIGEYEI